MKTTYTPGPWKIIEVCRALGIVPAKRPPGVRPREVEDICVLSLNDEQHDSQANARLIAAAPDLLKAIQKLVRRLDNGDTIEPGWYEVDEAREAIARAEGATP